MACSLTACRDRLADTVNSLFEVISLVKILCKGEAADDLQSVRLRKQMVEVFLIEIPNDLFRIIFTQCYLLRHDYNFLRSIYKKLNILHVL